MSITLRLIALITLFSAAAWAVPESGATLAAAAPEAYTQSGTIRQFTIRARRYAFEPARIEVNHGDIVKLTVVAEDVPHSFTIDEYRICKRVSPGAAVKVEFYADKRGTFVFYCNLTDDERCSEMRGTLVVR
jgi:cytochrome c oxidase subunit II